MRLLKYLLAPRKYQFKRYISICKQSYSGSMYIWKPRDKVIGTFTSSWKKRTKKAEDAGNR